MVYMAQTYGKHDQISGLNWKELQWVKQYIFLDCPEHHSGLITLNLNLQVLHLVFSGTESGIVDFKLVFSGSESGMEDLNLLSIGTEVGVVDVNLVFSGTESDLEEFNLFLAGSQFSSHFWKTS